MARRETELLEIERYPNPKICSSHLQLFWALKDSTLCRTAGEQSVLDALVKIGQFDKRSGVFLSGHPRWGLSMDQLAEVTKMRDKENGHRQLNRIVDYLRDEPSPKGLKSSEAKRAKALAAGKTVKPVNSIKPVDRLNVIHVIEREGQANVYIVHAQLIYQDAQKNLKANKDEYAERTQAQDAIIAKHAIKRDAEAHAEEEFAGDVDDVRPGVSATTADKVILDEIGLKAAVAAPAVELKAEEMEWVEAVTTLRDRLFTDTRRTIPTLDSREDNESLNAMADLLPSFKDADALARVARAVEWALVTKPWWRDKHLSGPKVTCPVAAFVKNFSTISGQAEQKAAKKKKAAPVVTPATQVPVENPHEPMTRKQSTITEVLKNEIDEQVQDDDIDVQIEGKDIQEAEERDDREREVERDRQCERDYERQREQAEPREVEPPSAVEFATTAAPEPEPRDIWGNEIEPKDEGPEHQDGTDAGDGHFWFRDKLYSSASNTYVPPKRHSPGTVVFMSPEALAKLDAEGW